MSYFVGAAYLVAFDALAETDADAATIVTWLRYIVGSTGVPDDPDAYASYAVSVGGGMTEARFTAALTHAVDDLATIVQVGAIVGGGDVLLATEQVAEYERLRVDLFPGYDDLITYLSTAEGYALSARPENWPAYAVGYGVSDADWAVLVRLALASGDMVERPSLANDNVPWWVYGPQVGTYNGWLQARITADAIAAWIHTTYGVAGAPDIGSPYDAYADELGLTDADFLAAISGGYVSVLGNYAGAGDMLVAGVDASEHAARLALVSEHDAFIVLVNAAGGSGLDAQETAWAGYEATLGVTEEQFATIVRWAKADHEIELKG